MLTNLLENRCELTYQNLLILARSYINDLSFESLRQHTYIFYHEIKKLKFHFCKKYKQTNILCKIAFPQQVKQVRTSDLRKCLFTLEPTIPKKCFSLNVCNTYNRFYNFTFFLNTSVHCILKIIKFKIM